MEYLPTAARGAAASYAVYCPVIGAMYDNTTSAFLNNGRNYNPLVDAEAPGTVYPYMMAAVLLTGFSVGMAASLMGYL